MFPRCLVDPMRPKVAEDISKPLKNSFIHTGHGAPFGQSWGSPAYIDDMYLRNPMEPPDLMGTVSSPGISSGSISASATVNRKSMQKQYSYQKLRNESNAKIKPHRPPQPKVITKQKDGILIDITPEEAGSMRDIASESGGDNRSVCSRMSLLDEPIDAPQGKFYFNTFRASKYYFFCSGFRSG